MLGSGAYTYEAIHDWGELPPRIKWGNTHGVVEDSQGNITSTTPSTRRARAPDSMVVFDAKGKFVRSWGKEFRGVAHGLHIRKEGTRRVPVPDGECREPEDDAAAGDAGGRRQDDARRARSSGRSRGRRTSTATSPGADGAPKRYNPTNVAIAPNGDVYVGDGYGSSFVNQYNSKAEYIRTFGGRGIRARASSPSRTASGWIRARASPILVVADRRNNRLQRFTLDGKHIDFVPGFRLPCHFDEHKGTVVIPDLHGRVTLMDRQQPDRRAPRRLEPADWQLPAAHAAAGRSSSRASSSARTARASIATATSSSWSGSRSDG